MKRIATILTLVLWCSHILGNDFEQYSLANCTVNQCHAKDMYALNLYDLTKSNHRSSFKVVHDSIRYVAHKNEVLNLSLVPSFQSLRFITNDKEKHFIAGRMMALAGEAYCKEFKYQNAYRCKIAPAVLAGFMKEAYDQTTGLGHPDVEDFLYTAAGSFYFTVRF